MTHKQLRERIKSRIDDLPASRLRSVHDFIGFVDSPKLSDETAELLGMPCPRAKLRRAESQVAQGRTTPWRKVMRVSR